MYFILYIGFELGVFGFGEVLVILCVGVIGLVGVVGVGL